MWQDNKHKWIFEKQIRNDNQPNYDIEVSLLNLNP